ncbi:MAG: TIGR03000 domain-containing protein [Planctomycetes bacterium]|nr:TIGR03000 domain-containing protein [Planctomycetota bacterium]
MYSVVVLMALSGGVDTPDFGRRGCHGCDGGCYGGYGCHGGRAHGRHGRHGCYGGCYGGGCYGGCYGGGCYGGCYGGGYGPGPGPGPGPKPMPGPKTGLDTPSPATVVVTLPADAKLTIDDYVTNSTSERRVFLSPALTPGKIYSYTLKAEVLRDNKPQVITKEVTVRAGEETPISFEFPAAVSARR